MGELIKNKSATLTLEQSEQLLYDCTPLVKASVFSSMIDEMKIDNQIQAINYIEEIDAFFKQCSKNDSKHTARQYRNGLTKLEAYTEENNINIFATLPVSRREGTALLNLHHESQTTSLCVPRAVSH